MIIFDCIAGLQDSHSLQPRYGANEGLLNLLRERR